MLNKDLFILKASGIPDIRIKITDLTVTRDRSVGQFNSFKMKVRVPPEYIGILNVIGGYLQSDISIYSPDGVTNHTATIMGSESPFLKHIVKKCVIEEFLPADSVILEFTGFNAQ